MIVAPREAARVRSTQAIVRLFPRRRFLFLQSVPGRFMPALARALAQRGHGVFRVNFNGGDRLAWRGLPATDFRGNLTDWPAF
ncbi:MAG: hypothetical protein INR62_12535, partial [Rhodospirillales bacterium]|nr:hypothetical protein [Acetobacter sp.]